jgi:hypothetical protein
MSAHSLQVKRLCCIACEIEDVNQPNPTEAHHLNEGGHAGQKRRGDEFQIPLCQWHHRAVRPVGMNRDTMTHLYGPSLALDSKQFRFAYGDDDSLLALTQHKLAQLEPEVA